MSFENPKVVVVGAGAMGGLFGGLLAEGGLDVTLVDAWPEHIAAIRQNGLRIVGVGGDRAIKVKATTDASEVTSADVVLFQCKAFANEAAASSVKHLFGGDDRRDHVPERARQRADARRDPGREATCSAG